MTANDLLKNACAMFHDYTPADYARVGLAGINIVLAEIFEVNNRIRSNNGKEPLEEIPGIAALDEALPYEDILTRNAMIYGLAEKLIVDERDAGLWAVFHQKYVNAVNEADRAFVTPVVLFTRGGI
jgi:hypothetical protein